MLAPLMLPARPTFSRLVLAASLASGLAMACAAKSRQSQDAAPGATAVEQRSDDVAEIDAELASYEAQLRTFGIAAGGAEAAGDGMDGGDAASADGVRATSKRADRCSTVCNLAEAICGLQERVCDLATEHDDEPRYAAVCERAGEDCALATSGCEDCRAP
jgi:hypothetical protein